uniref:Uncharacterized protein n=1 Tax=Panagrolaimus davidi TaxID=227884 RepID=A0A914PHY1_9BILA
MSAEQGYEQNLLGQHYQDVHTSFNECGTKAENDTFEKGQDIVNNVTGNANTTQPSHQHTANCVKGKCDVDHPGKAESGSNPYQTKEFNEGSHISTTKQ